MQKIELKNNLTEVIKSLKSIEIVRYLNNSSLDKNELLRLLIESKSGYDQSLADPVKIKVFDQFETNSVYSTVNFSNLFTFITTVSNAARANYVSNNSISNFYSFHKTLIATLNLVNNLLFESSTIYQEDELDIQKSQDNGNLILQIIDDNKIDLKKFTEISQSLKNLIDTIYLLYEKVEGVLFEEYPKIEMLDSGSDINFVLKLPEKAANLIAQIFKQFWDLIANNKSYRYRQKLKDVEHFISVLGKIEEAKENGKIEPEMAEVLKKGIFENTEKIIFRNTLTKQIVLESKEYSNRQILIEKTNTLLLEDKHEDPQ